MSNWKEEAQERAIKASQVMSNLVNYSGGEGTESFLKAMSCEHRTLQQSFTRLCLQWLEHVASDEYRTDLRNEDSKKIAGKLMQHKVTNHLIDEFIKDVAKEGRVSEEDVRKNLPIYLPSKWLGNV